MKNPDDRKYTKEHEWVKVEGDVATCGITDFAQHALTDIVFVELPDVGKQVEQMKPAGAVESVKSVSDIYAPVSGEIVEVNETLTGAPETVNNSPFEEGWMFKIKVSDAAQVDSLMSAEEYEKMTESEEH